MSRTIGDLIVEALARKTDASRVLVEDGLCPRRFVPIRTLHHRHLPEIRAGCGSHVEGARHLADRLAFYREGPHRIA